MENIIKMNDNTWRIEDGFVRFFLLTGTEKALLIDTGATMPNAREIAESLTSLPILLLNTHGDGDHTAGNGAFSEMYVHPDDYANCQMAEKYPTCKMNPLKDGDILDLGNRPLEIITIPGHTYGSVAILDEGNRMLICGDSVQNGQIFMFGEHRCPELFAGSLEKLMGLGERYDQICPSHGAPVLPGTYVKKVYDSWNKVLAGEASYTVENMFGTRIRSYTAPDCGFFCDAKE